MIPRLASESSALQFVRQKKSWIEKSLKRQAIVKNQNTIFTESLDFKTRTHQLHLLKHHKKTIKSVVSGNKIIVWYPEISMVDDHRIQNFIRKTIEETWRIEAKKYLPHRVKELASKYNFKYKQLTIKNVKTVLMFFNLVRTKAGPFPGFTC
ncbi:hypothetical protein ES705_37079 [subsurface metagenome]